MRVRIAAVFALLALDGCGASESAIPALDPSGRVVEWSHDCKTVTCSGTGTDSFDSGVLAGVDCDWDCAVYEGHLARVHARFLFDDSGCFQDPIITSGGCQ